jgi:predicted deacylase
MAGATRTFDRFVSERLEGSAAHRGAAGSMDPPRLVSSIDVAGLAEQARHELSLRVVPLGDGELSIPVKVIAGRGARPVFVLIAGIHGDEAEGVMALLDLWQALEPRDMRGRLVIVPVANPLAFAAARRTSPIDEMDLNRAFPGRREGSATQQLAHVLFHELVVGADLLLTLHSWYSYGIAEDFIECPRALAGGGAKARAAALASGFGRVRILDWPAGLLAAVANDAGVPAIEAEIGGMGRSLPENRARYCAHVMALLQHLDMVEIKERAAARGELCEARHVLAPIGGLIRLATALGAEVESGAVLGTIHDLHGRQLQAVHAPCAGRVGAHRTFVSVRPGDNLFTIFRRFEARPDE